MNFLCCSSSTVLKAVKAIDQIVDLSGSIVIDASGVNVGDIKAEINVEEAVQQIVSEVCTVCEKDIELKPVVADAKKSGDVVGEESKSE